MDERTDEFWLDAEREDAVFALENEENRAEALAACAAGPGDSPVARLALGAIRADLVDADHATWTALFEAAWGELGAHPVTYRIARARALRARRRERAAVARDAWLDVANLASALWTADSPEALEAEAPPPADPAVALREAQELLEARAPAEALLRARAAVQGLGDQLGDEHPALHAALAVLARAALDAGGGVEALSAAGRCAAHRHRLFAANHPSRLEGDLLLAAAHRSVDDDEAAEAIYRRIQGGLAPAVRARALHWLAERASRAGNRAAATTLFHGARLEYQRAGEYPLAERCAARATHR